MKSKLTWTTEKRKVKDLLDHKSNPRSLSKKSHADLMKSFKAFDYVELVAINQDNTILAGHQRVQIMLALGWGEKEIEVRVPSVQLTEEKAKEYLIRSNKNTGEWDWDILANEWEEKDLFDWGFEKEDFSLGENHIDDVDEEPIDLPDGDKSFTNITFTLSNDQNELVKRALQIAKEMGAFADTDNENSNGNALNRICEMWVGTHGKS
jgi:hypothetical protein